MWVVSASVLPLIVIFTFFMQMLYKEYDEYFLLLRATMLCFFFRK